MIYVQSGFLWPFPMPDTSGPGSLVAPRKGEFVMIADLSKKKKKRVLFEFPRINSAEINRIVSAYISNRLVYHYE